MKSNVFELPTKKKKKKKERKKGGTGAAPCMLLSVYIPYSSEWSTTGIGFHVTIVKTKVIAQIR